MMSKEQIFATEWLGRPLTFKTGKLAQQADAAVIVQYGDTVVLATVVESKNDREGIDYFPLSVDFEEKLYAAGIIKGSRWVKREGRPTDEAILSGRMVDRSIRPLFTGVSRKDTQVILTVLSADGENDFDIVALVAASAALSVSGVKWDGPIAGIRVGRVDGKFIFNPTYLERAESDLDLIVAGTADKTIMIEAGAKEVNEDDMYEAIIQGQEQMQGAIKLINEFKAAIQPRVKTIFAKNISDDEIKSGEEKEALIVKANAWLAQNVEKTLFNKEHYTKGERKLAVEIIKHDLDDYLFNEGIGKDHRAFAVKKTVEAAIDAEITKQITKNKRRVDGRRIDEIRALEADVEILPRNHGAGLFSRGETQVLSVTTLGAPGLVQHLEGLEGVSTKRFMHHYNFPPFSVGETGFMRGPGRRDIGHGALAEKALEPVLPSKEDFPYTIRVVSETMGSNGSSSMASTVAACLSLMDAGVPIKKAVAGLAIGLASNDDMSEWEVLTDIQDLEDGKGGMDFKVTGTEDGITAIQLDTKTNGITREIIKEALKKGRNGRLEILEIMKQSLAAPRAELSKYAPRIESFRINPEKIRDVIGSGGKIINKIIEETGVSIDIDDDGLVMICSTDADGMTRAVAWVKDLTREFEVGEILKGKAVRFMDFGVFVELAPGRDGMVHVSNMAPYRVGKPSDVLNIGDEVYVRIAEIDDKGRVNLTMNGLPENENIWKDKKGMQTGPAPERGPRPGGYNNSRGGDSRPPRR
ncbi:polyribonucleotide nucleotidyltransferase [Patescibacteria group bacterium]|nr:polyribonucleotide nucleotidyltransferase [Patescibacteria group bacterium]MBU4309719.1 polyribonucleotide nucleotidyltransferase [Patescibacteria group bacterium]MBU4431657.1 polyribonucleotide nucleotidyltransferase [Patescibacteria group bacterium]MBU4577893.1 polyribonucleotide nucleotidyltransferase [Patescibacteria group bacterium]